MRPRHAFPTGRPSRGPPPGSLADQCLREIAANGPATVNRLAVTIGARPTSIGRTLRMNVWFEKVSSRVWALSEAGRDIVKESTP